MALKNSYEEMVSERGRLRKEWRLVREERLKLKGELLAGGNDISSVRKDRQYKNLKKKQRRLFLSIKHLEKKINRKSSARKNVK